jgi:uncharacterized protein
MQCPIDGSDLVMTERSGVEIDYCPKCRGVWLDRGELDKILERTGPSKPTPVTDRPVELAEPAGTRSAAEPSFSRGDVPRRRSRDDDEDDDDRRGGRRGRRESFFSDLFDF